MALVQILEMALFGVFVCLLLGAIAVSGKFSNTLASILLTLAWIIGGLTIMRSELKDFRAIVLAFCVITAIVVGISLWLHPPKSTKKTESTDGTANPSTSARAEDMGVQLSISCDNVALPMAFRGDLWTLITVVRGGGLGKLMAPPGKESLWPEKDVHGFGYRCTVKNHGTQAAFSVSLPVTISKLNIIRTGDMWRTGEAKETHTVTVWIPMPLGQQGHDQFSFYVCSYDPDGALDIKLPSTAFINSDDPKNKREVSVKITSIAGNPFTVPPKELNAKIRPISPPSPHTTSLQPVTITAANVVQVLEVGKKIALNLSLRNNVGSALEIRAIAVTGIQPYLEDPLQMKALEDQLWELLEQKSGQEAPFILPSRTDVMAFTSETVPLTQELIDGLKSGTRVAYFLVQMKGKDGSIILDFCGHTNSSGGINYCRYHNGP